jgi:NAD(P)-dependent dehydrogenase (short-subunit alcohol dehydrogenase family)
MSLNPLDLSNRKILVTGASSGIGRATAIYLSKLGAKIVATGRNDDRLVQTLGLLEGKGHISIRFDLSDLDSIETIFKEAVKDGIKLNGMVHSAGIPFVMPLRSLTPSALQECFKIDFFCFVELVRQYSKTKYCDGGSIVAISSVTSVKPVAGEVGYSTAKAALNNAVLSMATELSKKNIRINGILAGNILTEMTERSLEQYGSKELKDNEVKLSLIGRWGTPEDVAATCAYLLSDMSSFTTAHLLDVGGGVLNRYVPLQDTGRQ